MEDQKMSMEVVEKEAEVKRRMERKKRKRIMDKIRRKAEKKHQKRLRKLVKLQYTAKLKPAIKSALAKRKQSQKIKLMAEKVIIDLSALKMYN